jgi:ABC-type multidrug transport system ATPase subunit
MSNLIDIRNLTFSYLSDLNSWSLKVDQLEIDEGAIYSIQGNNMSGKTTLLRIIAGLERISFSTNTSVSGLLLGSNGYSPDSTVTLRSRSTCFLSHYDRMFPEFTIWDNIRVAKNSGERLRKKVARERFETYIANVPTLQGRSARTGLGELSSGGQALIRLARAYSWRSKLILIDEVTAHLDPDGATTFFEHLGTLIGDRCSVVLVSHAQRDHELAKNLATQKGANYRSLKIDLRDNGSCLRDLTSS